MNNNNDDNKEDLVHLDLIYVIVKFGLGTKIIRFAKKLGIKSATILLGKGTIKNPILEFLEINEGRREIVLMGTTKTTAKTVLEKLNEEFKFEKPNKGIAFTVPLIDVVHSKFEGYESEKERGVDNPMYHMIFTIVDRGKGEAVVDAANKAGSRGATIINARGSGIHETEKFFGMEIEPEKEAIMIISQSDMTEKIVDSIKEDLKIDKPGNGIIFIQYINNTYGLY